VPASHKLDGLRAVLYVDNDSPSPALKTKLESFARAGGMLIVPHALAAEFSGEKPIECPVAGYDLRSFGKGSLATAARDWDDPFFLAADVRSLVGRATTPLPCSTPLPCGSIFRWPRTAARPAPVGRFHQPSQ